MLHFIDDGLGPHIGWIGDQLVTVDHSFFDTPMFDAEKAVERPLLKTNYQELKMAARGFFVPILRTDVCKMITEHIDYVTEVQTAFRKSNELISISDNPRNKAVAGDGPGALHKPRLAFFTSAPNAADDSPAGKVRTALAGLMNLRNVNTLLAPYRIVFVSARATFSLSMIAGLRPEAGPEGDSFRRAYVRLQKEDNRSYQTRKDVRWKELESAFSFQGFPMLKAQLLGALATNMIQYDNATGMTLKYDRFAPGDRMGTQPLGRDLDDATYIVHENAEIEMSLKKALGEEEKAPHNYGPKLQALTKNLAAYHLTDRQDPLDENRAKAILKSYIFSIPGLKVNYDTNLVAPTKQDYYRAATATTPEGYYCSCGALIMDMASTAPFPTVCNCGNRLLVD